MKKIIITNKLMALFFSGKTTPEETYAILKTAKTDKYIAYLIKNMETWKNLRQASKNSGALHVCQRYTLNHSLHPARRLAANSEANDCVVRCEQQVLKQRQGDKAHLKKLREEARRKDWLRADGTPLYNIGRLLELASLSVSRQFKGSIEMLDQELGAGCSIIAAINGEKLQNPLSRKKAEVNHAVVVVNIDTVAGTIDLFDPVNQPSTGDSTVSTYPMQTFLSAWKPSKNFFVSITERGKRPYTPHPEYVAHIKLPADIEAVAEMLAENAHDIWAVGRQKEEAEEREKGNEPKSNPYMKPFQNLPKKKQKSDFLTSLNTIKLIYKLGFTITCEKETSVDFTPNKLTADGLYIPNPIPTDDVVLPEEVEQLTEYIAENSHEEWAKTRLKEGWSYAPVTDRELMESADLIPYCELLDSEKEYDRKMAMNTLRVLYKLGYRIKRKNGSGHRL